MLNEMIVPIKEQYDNWYNSLSHVFDSWNKFGLLGGLKDEYHQRILAVLMENQKCIISQTFYDDDNIKTQQFNRLSIPLTRRVFSRAPFIDWIHVQPMVSPANDLFSKSISGEWMGDVVVSRTRFLKTTWPHDLINGPSTYSIRLDHECEIVEMLALKLADELCHEIIRDLLVNCAVEALDLDSSEPQTQTLNNVISCSGRRLGCNRANWMIVSKKMYDLLRSDVRYGLTELDELKWATVGRVFHVGSIKNDADELSVYCDSDFAENSILFGYRGDWQESGYSYMPYVFLKNPLKINCNDGTFSYPLETRYGKLLKRNGSNYYKLVTLNNVVFTQDESHTEKNGEIRSFCTFRVQKGELGANSSNQYLEPHRSGELVSKDANQRKHISNDSRES